ncbi:urea transporter [Trinickia sp. NRRL B-1857]|uniref:urea transporter n=1 Tax=Trinickia sp. NRRL B-1857 TaxID=3162879 RepID=UPI003D2D0C56
MQAGHDTDSPALRTVLRGIGQSVLQCNALTGACILAALALCDARLACAAAIGAVTAHVCAQLVGYDSIAIRDGLHAFNGVLCALAAATLIDDIDVALAVALLSAIAATYLALPVSRWLAAHGFALYSSPCLIVTWGWLMLRASARMSAGASAVGQGYAQAAPVRFSLDTWPGASPAIRMLDGLGDVCAAIAQTVFASGVLPGLLIVIGIALASRRAALYGILGATISTAIEWLCGAQISALHAGTAGFNGALAAIALVDGGPVGAFCAVMLSALLHQAAAQRGWPAMSAPFVASVWCVRLCARALTRVRRRPYAH